MTFLMLLATLALVTLPSIVWLYALADVTLNDFRTLGTKLIWIAVLCLFPPLGTLIYFLVGRSQRRTRRPVGGVVLLCILLMPILTTLWYYLQTPGPEVIYEPPAERSQSIRI